MPNNITRTSRADVPIKSPNNVRFHVLTSMFLWSCLACLLVVIGEITWGAPASQFAEDMPMSLFSGYITADGTLEMRPRKIMKKYFKSWLKGNLVELLLQSYGVLFRIL